MRSHSLKLPKGDRTLPTSQRRSHFPNTTKRRSHFPYITSAIAISSISNDVTQIPSSELLDFALQGMLEDGKKLLSQQNINLGAYLGKEIQMWDEKAGMTLTGRIFIVNQRMYMLLVGSDKNPQVSDIRKFFDSFQLMQ
jgi:hypothetical protein